MRPLRGGGESRPRASTVGNRPPTHSNMRILSNFHVMHLLGSKVRRSVGSVAVETFRRDERTAENALTGAPNRHQSTVRERRGGIRSLEAVMTFKVFFPRIRNDRGGHGGGGHGDHGGGGRGDFGGRGDYGRDGRDWGDYGGRGDYGGFRR
ncbi:hypothetical protein GCM10017688_16340 [Streptomyces ramulosus]